MWGAVVNAITASHHFIKLHQNAKNGKTAVSLQWLKNFALSHVDENMSTEDVVQKIIIPATVDLECRYVDILDPAVVGPPSCFISHRWGANFRELTKVLLQHFADEEDQDVNDSTSNPFVWLDIFAILQHKTNEQTSDLANLQNVIVQSHQTLLVLDDTGQVLRRVWCLFEVWKTVQHKSVSGLVVLARDVNLLGLKKIFTELNVAEAEATVEADRIKILQDIEQSIGIETMNGAIRSALVQSTMLEVARMLPRMTEKKNVYFRCIGKASQMCALAGLYADAQPLMIEALELSKELVGEMHELTASSYNNMAGLLRYTGKFSRAEPHQRRAVEISEAVSGNSARTRIYLGNLGQLLQNLGRLQEAETYLLRALSIPQANAGDLSTPHLLNSLASLYMDLGKPSEALPLYKKALDYVSRVLSPSDPEIAVYMANLAGVYVELKAFDEAEKLQRKAIEICERALGREHPTTAGCINNLGEILAQQKKLIEAHSLANEAYSIRLKLLGESHTSTANSLNNLAGILVELKRYEDAEPLMRKSLDLALNRSDSEKGRGSMEDAVTAARMHNLARVLDLNADPSHVAETAELYKKALVIREKLLGIDHVETTATASSLASFYSRSLPSCLDQASQLYQRVVESYKRQGASSGPRLLNALNHWSMCHHKNGRHEEAAKTAEQAIALASQLKGPSSPEVEAFKKMRDALLSHVAAAAARKQEEEKSHASAPPHPPPQPVSSVPPPLRGEASSFSPFFSPSSNIKEPRHQGGGEDHMEASLRGHLTARDKGEPEEDEDIWPSAAALATNQQALATHHPTLPSLLPSSMPLLSLRTASSSILSPNSQAIFSPISSRPSPSTPLSAVAAHPPRHSPQQSHSRPPSTPSSPLVPTSSNYFASILAGQQVSHLVHHEVHEDRSSAPVSSLGRNKPKASDPPSPLTSLPVMTSSPARSRQSPQAWMPAAAAPFPKIEKSSGDLKLPGEEDRGSRNRPSSLPRFDRRSVPMEPPTKPSAAMMSTPLSQPQRLTALVSPPRNRPDAKGGGSGSNTPGLSRETSQTKLPTGSPSSTRRPSKVELMMKAKLAALDQN